MHDHANAKTIASVHVTVIGSPLFSFGYAKKNKNVVKIKGGMVEGKVLSVEELMSFGELPSKNALVAQVLGTFLAPISSLAVVLNQILEQKGGAPAEEAPAEA